MSLNKIIINGGTRRYLSELPEFANGLPHGIVNKTKTDVGGTFVASTCDSNYIIVCPFVDLVKSIGADKNVKNMGIEVFECYGGIKQAQFYSYMKRNADKFKKIAVTFDSLPKLLGWMNNEVEDWKLLIDEYHIILESTDFRTDAINGLMNVVKQFNHYTFLSATPIEPEYEIDFFKNLPHYKVTWDNLQKIKVHRIKTTRMREALVRIISRFIQAGMSAVDCNGEKIEIEQLFIFVNSVTYIKQICDTLYIDPNDVKICCANRMRNKQIIGEYSIEPAIAPFKKINFFTSKCFQGCNMFSNSGLIIVASDGGKDYTLVDISTSMEQIAGRLRENEEYQNRFKNHIIHIYSTRNHIETDEEFALDMDAKEQEADKLISGYYKMNEEENDVYKKHLDLGTSLVVYENGVPVKSDLKRKCFQFRHQLKKSYADGIFIQDRYAKSEKFCLDTQEREWNEFDEKLAKMVIVSYQALLEDYIETRDTQYELEYPEFKNIVKYLTVKEMNSCKWNKETMIKMAEDKAMMETAFRNIYEKDRFFTNAELKKRLQEEFDRLGMKIIAKATLIKECKLYDVVSKKKNGKPGYLFGELRLDFKI